MNGPANGSRDGAGAPGLEPGGPPLVQAPLPRSASMPPGLHPWFNPPAAYEPPEPGYNLLPIRFAQFDANRHLITNMVGEFAFLHRDQLDELTAGRLDRHSPLYLELISKHFIYEMGGDVALDLLATKYRTRFAPISNFTSLHMFVLTLRCEHSCPYCQVSRVSSDRTAFDMTVGAADRALELMFSGPSRHLKLEFQGGEPLLNFDLLRHIVNSAQRRAGAEGRSVEFVVATNLALLTADMLEFLRKNQVLVSTSLDGPQDLHNANRPRPGGDSHQRAISGITRCREALGSDRVAALMTTTRRSLDQPEAIIDEYVRLGFTGVFLRWMSPYGFASRSNAPGYDISEWLRFYERGLRHILRLAVSGIDIREEYASTILRKMLTPFGSGYVDLQSPSGLGISAVVYNYDGDVYASDESRMLAESGDHTFRLGNVHRDGYEEIFLSSRLYDILDATMTEATPACESCAYEPFCGTDPTFHKATQGDMIGHRPTSAFCFRNMAIFRLLLGILEDEPEFAGVLRSWA